MRITYKSPLAQTLLENTNSITHKVKKEKIIEFQEFEFYFEIKRKPDKKKVNILCETNFFSAFFYPIFFHSILSVQPTRTKEKQNVRVVFPVLPHITPRKQLQRIFRPIEPGFPLSPPPPKKENFLFPLRSSYPSQPISDM